MDLSQYINVQEDNIIVSQEDKRLYRALELKNGLKILLINDPTTDKAAASLDVNVGHLQDPRELPGLAHFCEHMLFMGTEKYPVENDYQKYLSDHGGSSNAYTATDHTNYHFDVAPEHFAGAIDRFAQFFIAPLFTASATEREVNAVDSEHCNNVQNDEWRFQQVMRSFADPSHDYTKFGTGNRKTLLEDAKAKYLDTREELLKFHTKFYSSNRMTLCVLAKESLDQLAALVVPLFSVVVDKQLPAPEWISHPYGPDQIGFKTSVLPVQDVRRMQVYYPIPDLQPYYKSAPDDYVSHLLGHEGPNSLLAELKLRGWVNSLMTQTKAEAKGFAFFSIYMDLCEEGLDHVDDILVLLFEYVKMLQDYGPQEWIFKEVSNLSKMDFRFKDKEQPLALVVQLATAMHQYPFVDVLVGPYVMSDYKPDLLTDLLNKLTPNNCGLLLISKSFENKTDKKEEWYGTDYSSEKLSPTLLERCHLCSNSEGTKFKLPAINEYVPTQFDLFGRDKENNDKRFPEVLHNDPSVRLWYQQDNEYMLPKCCFCLHLRNPLVNSTPLNNVLANMFVETLNDALAESVYDASLAGLSYGLQASSYGLYLTVNGYNDKQSVLVETLISKIANFKPDPKRFYVLKERYIRSLKDFDAAQPYEQAVYYVSLILTQRVWSVKEILQEANGITIEQFNDFIQRYLTTLHIEAYVHGNCNKDESKKLVTLVKDTINRFVSFKPLFNSQLVKDREVCLPDGSFFSFSNENKIHSNSAVVAVFQTTVENTKTNMINELLIQILSEPCFNQLRTIEQLGYIVVSTVRNSNGSLGIMFIVQGEKSPDFMDSRIESFLSQMEKTLEDMSSEEFQKNIEALSAKRLEKPKELSALVQKYWSEIVNEMYHFDRDNVEVETLKRITKDDILKFYKSEVIKNVISFKSALTLHPLPKPYGNSIPVVGVCELKSML